MFQYEGGLDFLFGEVPEINSNVGRIIAGVFWVDSNEELLFANFKLGTFDNLLFIFNIIDPLGEVMDFNSDRLGDFS